MTMSRGAHTGHYPTAALRYAAAMSEAGIRKEDAAKARETIASSKELQQIFTNPVVTKAKKHAVIDRVFPEAVRSFLKVVVDHGKMDMILDILDAYEEQERRKAQIVTAGLRYVTPPSEEQKRKMEERLCKEFGAKQIRWELQEAPELIDGFVLRVCGKEYDYSMQGRWKRLEQTLTRR